MRAKRKQTTEDFLRGIRGLTRQLEVKAQEEDPWVLDDMLKLRDELDAVVVRTVAHMRSQGVTWDAIGYNLKISGVTAHKRYARKIGA